MHKDYCIVVVVVVIILLVVGEGGRGDAGWWICTTTGKSFCLATETSPPGAETPRENSIWWYSAGGCTSVCLSVSLPACR